MQTKSLFTYALFISVYAGVLFLIVGCYSDKSENYPDWWIQETGLLYSKYPVERDFVFFPEYPAQADQESLPIDTEPAPRFLLLPAENAYLPKAPIPSSYRF